MGKHIPREENIGTRNYEEHGDTGILLLTYKAAQFCDINSDTKSSTRLIPWRIAETRYYQSIPFMQGRTCDVNPQLARGGKWYFLRPLSLFCVVLIGRHLTKPE